MEATNILTWLVLLVSYGITLFIGMVVGAVFMAVWITNGLKKMHGAIEDRIRNLAENAEEDWKKGREKAETDEEKWLRRQLDGEDNTKETK